MPLIPYAGPIGRAELKHLLKRAPFGGPITLRVCHEQGQLIITVLNKEMAAAHAVDVELGDHQAGVYHTRMQVGSRQQVRSPLKVR